MRFEEYLRDFKISDNVDFQVIANDIKSNRHILFYGRKHSGKYVHCLRLLQLCFSPSNLKYEKKIMIEFEKQTIACKLSDVHYEVDFSIITFHTKRVWQKLFADIVDSINAKKISRAFIVCKHFHDICKELLECFHTYLFSYASKITFIMLSEHFSFFPPQMLHQLNVVRISSSSFLPISSSSSFLPISSSTEMRKSKQNVRTKKQNDKSSSSSSSSSLSSSSCSYDYDFINRKLVDYISNESSCIDILVLRELIYDSFVYHQDSHRFIWFLTKHVLSSSSSSSSSSKTKRFLTQLKKAYVLLSNAQRPFYHIEYMVMMCIGYMSSSSSLSSSSSSSTVGGKPIEQLLFQNRVLKDRR